MEAMKYWIALLIVGIILRQLEKVIDAFVHPFRDHR